MESQMKSQIQTQLSFRSRLPLAASLLAVLGAATCSSSEPSSGVTGRGGTSGSGQSGTAGTTTGTAGTTGSGTAGSTGSGTAGTTGSGTGKAGTTGTGTGVAGTIGTAGTTGTAGTAGTVPQKLCATKTKLMNPVLLNFENYDGTVTADKYAAAFGGATPNTGTVYTGPYAFGDGTATPTLAILAGHPPSQWAVSEKVMSASAWGMGGGIWMGGCADASAYKGVSFWVRGSSPTGLFSFSVSMDSTVLPDATDARAGGTCAGTKDTCTPATKTDIPVSADWTQVQLLWAAFSPGLSGATPVVPDGSNVVGFGWSVPLQFQLDPKVPTDAAGPYVPVPGDLSIDIDDIAFIP